MRRLFPIILLTACLGCQWARLRDPVPASLAASRKLCGEGNKLLEQNLPEKAEEQLAEAVRICPTDCDARRYYAEALWQRNARREAVAQLEEACRLNPDCDSRVRLAEMELEMGRLDDASRNVEEALNKTPKLAAAWRVRGRILRVRGDQLAASANRQQARDAYFQALTDLHRGAGYDPKDPQIIGETAVVYRCLDQKQRALETMQSLLETYSPGEEPQQVLFLTGLDYMALNRYEDAVVALAAASTRDHPSPEVFYRLAQAQNQIGRSQEAAESLQRALIIDPQHQPSRELLGQIEVARQGGAASWR